MYTIPYIIYKKRYGTIYIYLGAQQNAFFFFHTIFNVKKFNESETISHNVFN